MITCIVCRLASRKCQILTDHPPFLRHFDSIIGFVSLMALQ
jgi:hypothetical protein